MWIGGPRLREQLRLRRGLRCARPPGAGGSVPRCSQTEGGSFPATAGTRLMLRASLLYCTTTLLSIAFFAQLEYEHPIVLAALGVVVAGTFAVLIRETPLE